MKVYKFPQGSPEWLQCRAGRVTASMFSTARERVDGLTDQQARYVKAIQSGASSDAAMAMAGYKTKPRAEVIERALAGEKVGTFSKKALDYAFRLAIERISGQPLNEGYETWAMARGHELEPAARALHEARDGVVIEEAGFITTDDGLFGASADGFVIGEPVGAEYKCFVEAGKLRSILLDADKSDVMDQVQGGMWISGCECWLFALYCPALAPINLDLTVYPIERDDAYIKALEADLREFVALVDEFEQQLRRKAA